MVIGYYSDGYSRYMLECRDKNGHCYYRKFTDEDRMNYLFTLIPDTTEGHMFVCKPLDDADKKKPPIADPRATAYLSRQLAILTGKDLNPNRRENARIIAEHRAKKGVVHETMSDRRKKPLRHKLLPEDGLAPTQWQPSADAHELYAQNKGNIPAPAALPQGEAPPEDFDLDAWRSGGGQKPSPDTPKKKATRPMASKKES